MEFSSLDQVACRRKLHYFAQIALPFDGIFLSGSIKVLARVSGLILNRIFRFGVGCVKTEIIFSCTDRVMIRWIFFCLLRFGWPFNKFLNKSH